MMLTPGFRCIAQHADKICVKHPSTSMSNAYPPQLLCVRGDANKLKLCQHFPCKTALAVEPLNAMNHTGRGWTVQSASVHGRTAMLENCTAFPPAKPAYQLDGVAINSHRMILGRGGDVACCKKNTINHHHQCRFISWVDDLLFKPHVIIPSCSLPSSPSTRPGGMREAVEYGQPLVRVQPCWKHEAETSLPNPSPPSDCTKRVKQPSHTPPGPPFPNLSYLSEPPFPNVLFAAFSADFPCVLPFYVRVALLTLH